MLIGLILVVFGVLFSPSFYGHGFLAILGGLCAGFGVSYLLWRTR